MEIAGLKLIHKTGAVDIEDDPSYPYKIEVECRPPEFMSFTFVSLYGGSERVVVRGLTLEAVQEFDKVNNFRRHPRLRSLTITGPERVIEKYDPRAAPGADVTPDGAA